MADRFYSVNKGETEFQITEGSSTSSESIELRVALAVATPLTKNDVLVALDMFKNHILKGNWEPA